MTAGGTQAIFCAIGAFVRAGDEVILLEPCYDSYRPSVETVGGVAVPYTLTAPDYAVNWAEVGHLMTPAYPDDLYQYASQSDRGSITGRS